MRYRLRTKSLAELKTLLQGQSISLPEQPQTPIAHTKDDGKETTPVNEEKLLSEAMEGVVPLAHDEYVERVFPLTCPEVS